MYESKEATEAVVEHRLQTLILRYYFWFQALAQGKVLPYCSLLLYRMAICIGF